MMRRTIPLSVAAVLAVLALAVGVGIGQPVSSHGGTPSDVFMKTQPAPEACVEDVNPDSVTAFPLQIQVAATSHVLGYFTFEWNGLERGETGQLNLVLDGTGSDSQYDYARTKAPINPNGTVMWSFPNVAPGTHTLAVFAWIDQTSGNPDLLAGLENCSLTAFVMPVAA
jgi:hypothetical protein